ncbi:aminopeptidase A-like [Asterias amurensis]|uniref:aminopeptidase A-like n=1 Tax=Asterias amurensis TaxID=7602 RepID=UPI003AB7EF8E
MGRGGKNELSDSVSSPDDRYLSVESNVDTKSGIYVRKSQIVASVVLVLVLTTGVGLMAGLLPECDVPSKGAITAKPFPTTGVPKPTDSKPTEPKPTETNPTEPMPVTTPAPCLDDWCKLRLPAEIYPEHYNLLLYPDLTVGSFSGTVDVDIKVTGPIKFPRIHILKMDILSSEIKPKGSSTPLSVVRMFGFEFNEFWVMEMTEDLQPGDYVWSLAFTGSLIEDNLGFYMSSYKNSAGETRNMTSSKFEPTSARKAFPCFDEPNLKAEYTTTLVHPPAPYLALSNMNVNMTTNYTLDPTLMQTTFERSVMMSTYLACFVVCDFAYKEIILDSGLPFRVYAPPDQIDQVDYSLSVGANVTEYFEKYFDLAYPLPKLDMIAIPDFVSGAMEHWGLITYREVNLLYSETDSAESNKQRVAEVVAHELAHQWFGNIVTMDWWDDLWLNEGFASYVEYLGVDYVHPDWQKMNQFLNQDFIYVMGNDQIVSSHPIIVPVNHPDEINEIFDSIPYSKGASVLRMLNEIVTEDVFKAGVASYLKKYAYQNAVSDDLWAEITEACKNASMDINVKKIMDTWTLQMGFPVVTMTKRNNGGSWMVDADQTWFLVDPQADKSKDEYGSVFNYTWNIRFNYLFESNPSTFLESPMEFGGVSFPWVGAVTDWYIANPGKFGYYRVNYDTENWKALSEQLMDDHQVMDIRDRAGLLDDAFNLARAELIDYSIPLDMTRYLSSEEEYTPWDAAYDNIIWLRETLRYRPVFAKLRTYFAGQAAPMLKKLTWNDEGSHLERYLRSDIIYMSCGFGDPDCLDEAVRLFRTYLNGSSISVNIRSHVYRFGMEEIGDQEAWDILWENYMNSDVASEKTKLRYALARTRQVWLLSRYLEYCRDPSKIRGQDFFSTLGYIADNPVGNLLVWDWVRANYDYLLDRFGVSDRYLGRLVPGFTDYWNTEQKLKELEDFWEEYPDAGAGSRGRLQAVERIRTNINWLAKNEDTISMWLDNNLA